HARTGRRERREVRSAGEAQALSQNRWPFRIIAPSGGTKPSSPTLRDSMRRGSMKRYVAVIVAVLAGMLVSCGGSDGDGKTGATGGGSPSTPSTPPTPPAPPIAMAGTRVEESNAAVTQSGAWVPASADWGWSGGSAVESTTAGATVTV